MWLGVYLLYCVLQESSGCSVERGLEGEITRSVGGSVVLPCSCKNLQEVPQAVQWGFTSKIIIGYYTADHSVFPEDGSPNQRYRDRVQRREQDTPGDSSLIISHLTEEDEGTYLCGNGGYSRVVTLYVRGCTVMCVNERTFTRAPGESVLLPCPCPRHTFNINPKRVTWSFIKTGSTDQTPVSNDTESYRGRVWTFDQTPSRNFSLLLSDLTEEDSGEYTCTADDHTPYVTLHVKGSSVITLYVCAALLLIGLIGLIGGLTYRWRLSRTQGATPPINTGSVSTNPPRRTRTPADDDYENDPRNVSMGPVYQSLDPKTNQSDSVYQSLDPSTNQSDSVYQSLNSKTK